MKPHLPVLLICLTAVGTMSCKGPTPHPKVAAKPVAKPVAANEKPAVVVDPEAGRNGYWSLAMKRYKPVDTMGSTTAVDEGSESEATTTENTVTPPPTVANASTPAPISLTPPAEKPPPLVPAKIPFATRIPGKLGLVKSPYDPTGQSIDVRDFATGQMARCPYSGKIFRVPP